METITEQEYLTGSQLPASKTSSDCTSDKSTAAATAADVATDNRDAFFGMCFSSTSKCMITEKKKIFFLCLLFK